MIKGVEVKTNAIILSGFGFNTEQETKYCIEKAGGNAKIVHVNKIIENNNMLNEANFIIIPGGATFDDVLGPGKLMANKLKNKLGENILEFISDGKLILGTGNGFHTLVKMGLLPFTDMKQRITILENEYINEWTYFKINQNSACIFTKNIKFLTLPLRCKTGKVFGEEEQITHILNQNLYVMQYMNRSGKVIPHKTSSAHSIAGLCNKIGNIFGLIPHPESFCFPENFPGWIFGTKIEPQGLKIYENPCNYLAEKY